MNAIDAIYSVLIPYYFLFIRKIATFIDYCSPFILLIEYTNRARLYFTGYTVLLFLSPVWIFHFIA